MKRILPFLAVCSLLLFSGCTYYMGHSWERKFPESPPPKPLQPLMERDAPPPPKWQLGKELVEHWANKDLGDWKKNKKVGSPRILIAKLMLNQDVEEVNAFLMNAEAGGISGTSGFTNKKGDYDFTEINLCTLLYKFGEQPDLLYPETRDHLLNDLIIDSGNKARTRAPHTLGIIGETENHVLMTEGSRYLKNQWIYNHGNPDPKFDNKANGQEKFLLEFLEDMTRTGFFEFNADPYSGYTFTALLTIHAWAESELIRKKILHILHEANFKYVLGSSNYRRYPPFRRRMEKASRPELDRHPHSIYMRIWAHRAKGEPMTLKEISFSRHHALLALILPYELPDPIVDLIEKKDREYFVRLGHGFRACPEVYSGGPGWILSAGGVRRGKTSQISSRHTVLLLEDEVTNVEECFYLPGKGKIGKWNNTGVHRRLAVGPQPVHIPEGKVPVVTEGNWQLFQPYKNRALLLLTYSESEFGLMAIFPQWQEGALALMDAVKKVNPEGEVSRRFVFPDQSEVGYDVGAKKNRWVITTVGNETQDRKFDFWPRWDLELAEDTYFK